MNDVRPEFAETRRMPAPDATPTQALQALAAIGSSGEQALRELAGHHRRQKAEIVSLREERTKLRNRVVELTDELDDLRSELAVLRRSQELRINAAESGSAALVAVPGDRSWVLGWLLLWFAGIAGVIVLLHLLLPGVL